MPELPEAEAQRRLLERCVVSHSITSVNALEWTRLIAKYPSGASLPPPLFSSTVDRMHLDLAWPDFSFYMPRRPHKLRTPPWSKLHAQMLNESASLRWCLCKESQSPRRVPRRIASSFASSTIDLLDVDSQARWPRGIVRHVFPVGPR